MSDLKVTLFQSSLHWESREKNLEMFTKLINSNEKTDLLVLPEMFNSGFTMKPENVAENMKGKTVSWMQETAYENNASLTGSLVVEEDDLFYNRQIYVKPDGEINHYDKRHLFGLAGEDQHYTPGKSKVIVQEGDWKIMLQTCFDMRFPESFSNQYINHLPQYDVLLNVANWPAKRSLHWTTLLRARAIENQCYTIGLNRVGKDPKGLEYSGDSRVFDPLGEVVQKAEAHQETTVNCSISSEHLKTIREKLPFLKEA